MKWQSSISATSSSISSATPTESPTSCGISASPSTIKHSCRSALETTGVKLLDSRFLDFLDPWGNRVEITTYTNIQFTKADHVLQGMGLGHLKKSDEAIAELRAKGLAPDGK